MNEGKTLFQIMSELDRQFNCCYLLFGPITIDFGPNDHDLDYADKTYIFASSDSHLTITVDDSVLFEKYEISDNKLQFRDCNNLGYRLTIIF